MSIEKALQEYVATQEMADKDLNGIPSSTRAGWMGVKQEAKDALPGKFKSLQRELELGSIAIGVSGDAATVQDFVSESNKRSDTVTLSRDALYGTIAERLMPLFGETKQFGPAQFNMMITIFRGLVADMGIQVLIQPQFRDVVVVNDAHQLTGIVRGLIEDAVGDALVVHFLRGEITRRVIDKKVTGEKIFVVVVDGDHQTMESLSSKSLAIKVSPPVTGENVTEVFEKLLGHGKHVETIEQQPTKKQKKQKKEEANNDDSN